jgi:hypothetical protein
MGSAAFRALSGRAVRLWLLLESNASPNVTSHRLECFLSQRQALARLGGGPNLICAGFRQLQAAEIIRLVKRGSGPGRMGGAKRHASLYWLPHRTKGESIFGWRSEEDEKVYGFWRVHNEQLRSIAKNLSDIEAKVFVYCMSGRRTDDGYLIKSSFTLSVREISDKLNISIGAASEALNRLVEKKFIDIEQKGRGRAPVQYAVPHKNAVPVRRPRSLKPKQIGPRGQT